MAYLNNNQQQDQDNVQGMNTPNQPNQNGQQQTGVGQGSAQSSTIEGGAQSQQSQSAPNSSSPTPSIRAAKPQGSGLFTNLNKYIDQNKPKAEGLGQNLVNNYQNQINKNIQQANQQNQQFTTQLQNEKQRMQTAEQKVKSTGSQIAQAYNAGEVTDQGLVNTATPATPYTLNDEDYNTTRSILQGQTKFNDINELNVAEQQYKADQLAKAGTGAYTEEGRRSLLRQAFAPTNKYSAGQQRLDDLILKGSGEAGKVANTLSKSGQANKQALQDIIAKASSDLGAYRTEESGLVGRLRDALTGNLGQVDTQLQQRVDAIKTNREKLAAELGISEEEATKYADQLKNGVRSTFGDVTDTLADKSWFGGVKTLGGKGTYVPQLTQNELDFLTRGRLSNMDGGSDEQRAAYDQLVEKQRIAKAGPQYTIDNSRDLDVADMNGIFGNANQGGSGTYAVADMVNALTGAENLDDEVLQYLGLDRNIVGSDGAQGAVDYGGARFYQYGDRGGSLNFDKLGDFLNNARSQYDSVTGAASNSALFDRMNNEDASYAAYKAGEDINKKSAATQGDTARYNALQDLLMGRNIGDRSYLAEDPNTGKAYANQQELLNLKKKVYEILAKGGANSQVVNSNQPDGTAPLVNPKVNIE